MNELATELAARYGARDWHDQRKDLASVMVDVRKIARYPGLAPDEAGYVHLSFMTAIDKIERKAFTLTYALRNHEARATVSWSTATSTGTSPSWTPSTSSGARPGPTSAR